MPSPSMDLLEKLQQMTEEERRQWLDRWSRSQGLPRGSRDA